MTKINSKKSKDGNFAQKKVWQKPLFVILLVLLNIVVIVAAAISEFGNSEEAAKLSDVKMNGWLLIPAALCFIVAMVLEVYKYALMIRRMSSPEKNKQHNAWQIARRTVLLGRYYDNITPAAVGGQPFQIYYMRKNSGLAKGPSASIPIFGMISIQISFIIIALICFLFGGVAKDNPALIVTAAIGLLFYAFWPVMVAAVSLSPKSTTKFLKFIIRLLAKFKIVKNKAEALKKIEGEVDEYASSVKTILKTKGLFSHTILLSTIYNLLMASIPFFVLLAFGGNVDFWSCFATTIAVMSAIYFVPTPGNSGAAEGTFFVVFSALSSGYIFWAMLTWRFFSYYAYIAMGPITYLEMHLEKRRLENSGTKYSSPKHSGSNFSGPKISNLENSNPKRGDEKEK